MEGQVFLPYTGIGGFNMSNGIMALNVTGSSGEDIPPEYATGVMSISWIYPGGIVSKTYNGSGLWGYLLSVQSEGGTITTDDTLTERLRSLGYINDKGEVTDSNDVREYINDQVKAYYARILAIDETEENLGKYGIQAFKNTFDGCYRIM